MSGSPRNPWLNERLWWWRMRAVCRSDATGFSPGDDAGTWRVRAAFIDHARRLVTVAAASSCGVAPLEVRLVECEKIAPEDRVSSACPGVWLFEESPNLNEVGKVVYRG